MILLKSAVPYETRQITLFVLKFLPDRTYEDLYKEILKVINSENGKIYVVIRQETVIAFAQCELQYDSIESRTKYPAAVIRSIFVGEEYQNKRLGSRLIEKCGAWAGRYDCDKLIIDCLEGDERYLPAIEKLGFSEEKKFTRYHKTIV